MTRFQDGLSWLLRLFGVRRWSAVACEDLPEALRTDRIYFLTAEGHTPWSAAFLCPCGCQETIQLSLLPNDSPSWKFSVASNAYVTLHPSVWRVRGCRSHFFIRSGRLVWARGRDEVM